MLHHRAQSRLLTARRVVALAAASVLTIGGTAIADSAAVDGDSSNMSNSKNSKFTLCQGDGSFVDVVGTINYSGTGNGAKHFADNGVVTITASVPAAAASFLSADGGSVTTADWDDTSDAVTTAAMPLTVEPDWAPGTYHVEYTFSGLDQDGRTYTLRDTNIVQITEKTEGCGTGSVPNTAPTVDVTGFTPNSPVEIGTAVTPACDVVDAEDDGEYAVPDVSGPVGPLAAYGLGAVTVTCFYEDEGGMSATDTASYTIVDTGAPMITDEGPATGPDGLNNWYVSAVANSFRATDAGAGFETATPPQLTLDWTKSSGAAEGSAVKINSGTATDVAGNVGEAIDSAALKIDLSNPVLNVTGAEDGAAFDVCNGVIAKPTFIPTDAISGLDGTEDDDWVTPSTGTGVGTYTYKATATDLAGRSTTETRTFTSTYGAAFSGALQPINGGATPEFADDTSRFKLGSTVPVKFRLVCGSTPISGAVAKLNVKQADGKPDPGTDEAGSTAASTTGNLFRYDATAGQYIFNLSTKNGYTNANGGTVSFTTGTYTLSIMLDDGTYRSVNINLVK
jgi:hypothetical protein